MRNKSSHESWCAARLATFNKSDSFCFFSAGLGAGQNIVCLKTDRVQARFFHLQLVCIAFKICMQIAAELINTNKVLLWKNLMNTKTAIFYNYSYLVLLPLMTPNSCFKEPCMWAETLQVVCS